MRADPSILLRLDAETKAPYWPVAVEGQYTVLVRIYQLYHMEISFTICIVLVMIWNSLNLHSTVIL